MNVHFKQVTDSTTLVLENINKQNRVFVAYHHVRLFATSACGPFRKALSFCHFLTFFAEGPENLLLPGNGRLHCKTAMLLDMDADPKMRPTNVDIHVGTFAYLDIMVTSCE